MKLTAISHPAAPQYEDINEEEIEMIEKIELEWH